MASWGIAKAKAQFSELVHAAEKNGPQTVLRSGREVAVVVSIEEWKPMRQAETTSTPRQSLYDILMDSPLTEPLAIPRLKMRKRIIF